MNKHLQQQLGSLSPPRSHDVTKQHLGSSQDYAITSERARIHLRVQKALNEQKQQANSSAQTEIDTGAQASQAKLSVTSPVTKTKLRTSLDYPLTTKNSQQGNPFTVNQHQQQLQIPLEALRPNAAGIPTIANRTQSSSQSKVLAGHNNMGPPDHLSRIFFNNKALQSGSSDQSRNRAKQSKTNNTSHNSPRQMTEQLKQSYRLPHLDGSLALYASQGGAQLRSSAITKKQLLNDYLEGGQTSPQSLSASKTPLSNFAKDEAILRIANQVSKQRNFFEDGANTNTQKQKRYFNNSEMGMVDEKDYSRLSPVLQHKRSSEIMQSNLPFVMTQGVHTQHLNQNAPVIHGSRNQAKVYQSYNLGAQKSPNQRNSSQLHDQHSFDRRNILRPTSILNQSVDLQQLAASAKTKGYVARSKSQLGEVEDKQSPNGNHVATIMMGARNVVRLSSLSNAQVALETTYPVGKKVRRNLINQRYASQETQQSRKVSSSFLVPTPTYLASAKIHQQNNAKAKDPGSLLASKNKRKESSTIKIDGSKINLNDNVTSVVQLLNGQSSKTSIDAQPTHQRKDNMSIVEEIGLPYRGSSLPTGLGQMKSTLDHEDSNSISNMHMTKQITVGRLQLEEHQYSQRNMGQNTLYNDPKKNSLNNSSISISQPCSWKQQTEDSSQAEQINKASAMSRHQNLKSETHDFLLSLVKKASGNPVGSAYQNCFNKTPKQLQGSSNAAIVPSVNTHSVSLQVNPQAVIIKDEHLGFMLDNQKHRMKNLNGELISLSSEKQQKTVITTTIKQLQSLASNEDFQQASQKLITNKQKQQNFAQIKKDAIQAAQVRMQPSSKHVQRLMSPVKRSFQLRQAKDAANLFAAQIAQMSVQGESPTSLLKLNRNNTLVNSTRTLYDSKATSPMDRSKATTPVIQCPKCHKIDNLSPNVVKNTAEETQENSNCNCKTKDQETMIVTRQDAQTDFLKKMQASETNKQHTRSKVLLTKTNSNEQSIVLSRLNLQIDEMELPPSQHSNKSKSDASKTPVLTTRNHNPSLRMHQLQQQQSEVKGSKRDLYIVEAKTSPRNKQITKATQNLAKKKAIQPRQANKQIQDKNKAQSNQQQPHQQQARVMNASSQIRVHSLHDRVVSRDVYFEQLRHNYEQRLCQQYKISDIQPNSLSTIQNKSISSNDSPGLKNRVAAQPLQLAKFIPIRQQHLSTKKNASIGTSDLAPLSIDSPASIGNSRSPNDMSYLQIGIKAGHQNSLKKNISIQNLNEIDNFNHRGTLMTHDEFVLSSAHSKETVARKLSSCLNDERNSFIGSENRGLTIVHKRNSDASFVESPTISPLKARLHMLDGNRVGLNKRSAKKLVKNEKASLMSLKALKDPNNSSSRKRITSKISQHHLKVNPSTIMSIGSHEMSTIRTGTNRRLKSNDAHQFQDSDSDKNRTLKGRHSSQNLCVEESEYASPNDLRKGRRLSSSNERFPSIDGQSPNDVKSKQSSHEGFTSFEQHLIKSGKINVMPLGQEKMHQRSLEVEKQRSEEESKKVKELINIKEPDSSYIDQSKKLQPPVWKNTFESQSSKEASTNTQRLVLMYLNEDLDLVDEVSKSSEYTQAIQDSRNQQVSTVSGLSAVMTKHIDSGSSHGSLVSRKNQAIVPKAISSVLTSKLATPGGPVSPLIHIVDQRAYQENCDKLFEAHKGLQEALNLSSRTPISPAHMTNESPGTRAQSSFSFYKFDESISRRGGYALANGAQIIQSRESSARQGEDSFSFAKLRLGDTFCGVVVPNNQNMIIQSARYTIQKSDGGIQVSGNHEIKDEQAMDSFLEQIDLSTKEKNNEETQVQNISSYLNVRRSDPLLLFPNFKNDSQGLPVEHIPALYRDPKSVAPVMPLSQPQLELFQF